MHRPAAGSRVCRGRGRRCGATRRHAAPRGAFRPWPSRRPASRRGGGSAAAHSAPGRPATFWRARLAGVSHREAPDCMKAGFAAESMELCKGGRLPPLPPPPLNPRAGAPERSARRPSGARTGGETRICRRRGRPAWSALATAGSGSTSPASTRPSTISMRCACSARPASMPHAWPGAASAARASASGASCSAAPRRASVITARRAGAPLQCRNLDAGCYHDLAAHLDGSGRCLVRGCACGRFVRREARGEERQE